LSTTSVKKKREINVAYHALNVFQRLSLSNYRQRRRRNAKLVKIEKGNATTIFLWSLFKVILQRKKKYKSHNFQVLKLY